MNYVVHTLESHACQYGVQLHTMILSRLCHTSKCLTPGLSLLSRGPKRILLPCACLARNERKLDKTWTKRGESPLVLLQAIPSPSSWQPR